MTIFMFAALVNSSVSLYLTYSSLRKLERCKNKLIIQIINIAPALGLASIALNATFVASGPVNSIWDVRLMAWNLWDLLVMLLVIRMINVLPESESI